MQQIKAAILRSQAKALAGVNQEQPALYYGIGRYISQHSRTGFWGTDAIEAISRQLSAELPGLRGFSASNLRNMRTFYEEWLVLDGNIFNCVLICSWVMMLWSDADRTFCEYVLLEYQRPMGVATYKTSQQQLRDLLPDEEEMKRLMGKSDAEPDDDR